MTDKALVLDRPGELIPSADTLKGMWNLAAQVAKSGLAGYNATPEKVLTIAITGRELGLPFMAAVRGIHVIEGKPSPSAALVAALIYNAHGDNALRVTKSTAQECTIKYRRAGWPEGEFDELTLTMKEAQEAGWHEAYSKKTNRVEVKDTWKKFPKAMLRSRAVTLVGQDAFPDVVLGLYSPDELDSTDVHVEDISDNETGRVVAESEASEAGKGTQGGHRGGRGNGVASDEHTPAPVVVEAVDTETGEIIDGEYTEVDQNGARQDHVDPTTKHAGPEVGVSGDGEEFFALVRDLNRLLEHPLPEKVNKLHDTPLLKGKDAQGRVNALKRALHTNLLKFIEDVGFDENHLNAVKKEWGEHKVWAAVEEKWESQLAQCEETPI